MTSKPAGQTPYVGLMSTNITQKPSLHLDVIQYDVVVLEGQLQGKKQMTWDDIQANYDIEIIEM